MAYIDNVSIVMTSVFILVMNLIPLVTLSFQPDYVRVLSFSFYLSNFWKRSTGPPFNLSRYFFVHLFNQGDGRSSPNMNSLSLVEICLLTMCHVVYDIIQYTFEFLFFMMVQTSSTPLLFFFCPKYVWRTLPPPWSVRSVIHTVYVSMS